MPLLLLSVSVDRLTAWASLLRSGDSSLILWSAGRDRSGCPWARKKRAAPGGSAARCRRPDPRKEASTYMQGRRPELSPPSVRTVPGVGRSTRRAAAGQRRRRLARDASDADDGRDRRPLALRQTAVTFCVSSRVAAHSAAAVSTSPWQGPGAHQHPSRWPFSAASFSRPSFPPLIRCQSSRR